MTSTDSLHTESAEKPVARSRRSNALKIGGIVVLAVALFGGGILAANALMDDGPDPVSSASDGLVLQQLAVLTQQADQIIADVRQLGDSDAAKVRDSGVQLQVYAVQMADLSKQAASEDLRDATEKLSDGYLGVGVGLVTNSASATSEGVAALEEAQRTFQEYLGLDPSTDQSGTDQSGTGTDQQDSGN